MKIRTVFLGVAVIAAAVLGIQRYTAADHLSCADFVSATSTRQLEAIHQWQKANGGRPMAEMSDGYDISMMTQYCSQASHAGDVVQDLTIGFGSR